MVFGNLGKPAPRRRIHARPVERRPKALREWLANAQGEDVRGRSPKLRTPIRAGGTQASSFEERMPAAFKELSSLALKLERHFKDIQDIEFTVEDGKLYVLQCRSAKRTSRAAVRAAVDMAHEGSSRRRRPCCGSTPAHSNSSCTRRSIRGRFERWARTARFVTDFSRAACRRARGRARHIVFDADEAERRAGQGKPVILVRAETSPEDIHGMKGARGILTARGGMTSHAAVVARGMGQALRHGCRR